MAFTQNFNSNTFGPVHWELMGPIADRPATADLHTTYVSTDEGDGMLKAYLYTESGWMQMQGIEGFTSGSGGGSGGGGVLLVVNLDNDTNTLDRTWQEIADADLAVVKISAEGETATELVNYVGNGDNYFVDVMTPDGTVTYACDTADGYPVNANPQ